MKTFDLSCALILTCASWCGGQALRPSARVLPAYVKGHVTIDEFVGRTPQTTPVAKLKLYLLRAEDSRPMVELQEGCRRGMKDPHADIQRAYSTCTQNLRRVVALVPTLPAIATTETDREGADEFAEVPAAASYYVVVVKTVEGAEPWAIVGLTNKLAPGGRITLDLSPNDPWTRSKTP